MLIELFIWRFIFWMKKVYEYKVSILFLFNFGYNYFFKFLKDNKSYDWDLFYIRVIVNGVEFILLELCDEFLIRCVVFNMKWFVILNVYGLVEVLVGVIFFNIGERFVFVYLYCDYLNLGERVVEVSKED